MMTAMYDDGSQAGAFTLDRTCREEGRLVDMATWRFNLLELVIGWMGVRPKNLLLCKGPLTVGPKSEACGQSSVGVFSHPAQCHSSSRASLVARFCEPPWSVPPSPQAE